jgi:hypothetical protein
MCRRKGPASIAAWVDDETYAKVVNAIEACEKELKPEEREDGLARVREVGFAGGDLR